LSYTRDNKRYRYDFHDYLRDNGTEVKEYGLANNGTTTIYTVTADTVLYIDSVVFECENSSGGRRVVRIEEVNGAFTHYIMRFGVLDNTTISENATYPTLYTVPAGYDINVVSPAANCQVYASIHGWEL